MTATAYAPGYDVAAKAGYDDPSLQNLPAANIRQAGQFDPNEFETVANVPIFAEHETVARNGRQLRFGRDELSAIVERCNRRINETGDYAALTLGHTPSPEDRASGVGDPELVGFAGPFRLGTLGNPGERQRYAILADCHYFRDDMAKVRKHPRRSPEVWLEDRYEEMFFDPIALLGAEAPRLDMGLLYGARRHGRIIEKYTAAAPAAGNVFVPSDEIRKDYSAGGSMIAPEDVKAIVDAVSQLPEMAWVKSQMTSSGAAPGGAPGAHPPAPGMPPAAPAAPPGQLPGAVPPPPHAAAAPPPAAPAPAPAPAPVAAAAHPAPPPAPAPHPAPAAAPAAPPPAAPPHAAAAPGPGPGGPPPAPKPAAPAGGPSANGNGKEDKDKEPKKMQAQYAAGDGTGPNADDDYNAAADLGGATIDHEIGNAKAKYAAADDMFDDEEDFEKYSAYRRARMKKYEAGEGDVDADSGDPIPAGASVEGKDGGPAKGDVDPSTDEAASSYGGTGTNIVDRYAKTAATVEKYGKRIATLEAELRTERAARVDAEREATLIDLRINKGLLIDPKRQMEKLNYSKVSDKEFKERIDFMLEVGNRIPINEDISTYVADSPAVTGVTRERYSKEHSDRAKAIAEAKALRGEPVDYAEVLDAVRAGKM